jgi:2-dehydro-3-deoxyphosphogluconate aldolase/(4S)-4-hydroxy-2-oxoglutarate aldolase
MNKLVFSWEKFYHVPIVGIMRNFSLAAVKDIMPVYQAAALHCIEITMNTKNAADIIHFLRRQYPALNIGAGTVCTQKDLQTATDAGAQFIVTPVTDKKIIRACVKQKLPVFPGAFTPTEIYKAWTLGASMVKLYPAKVLGAAYIKDIKAPFNHIKLLPTGGVGLDDIPVYRQAGADGFGIGSPLFNKQLIEEKNWAALLEHFKSFAAKASAS